MAEGFARRFRRIITNTADGVPPWLDDIAGGSDAGLYAPTDSPWVVHADVATLIGGIRALLVQALHPGSLAGVAEHSRYAADPLGRLAGTTRWLTIMTFGSTDAIAAEAKRVNAMHSRVIGQYTAADGERQHYRAADESLLLWVHVAFTDSFLTAYQLYSGSQVDGDDYVRQWARAVEPLGLPTAPRSLADLRCVLADFAPVLACSDTTREVVRFLRRPPLSRAARVGYWFLFQAAAASLQPEHRQMLGLRRVMPLRVARPVGRAVLRAMRAALGPTSPLEQAALARRARVAAP